MKKLMKVMMVCIMTLTVLTGCSSSSEDKVIIYSNADDEAITAMESTLNDNGYEGKYIIQSFGTSELGGKLLAEGTNIEADIVTMSSYYIDSANEEHDMFVDLDMDVETIDTVSTFYTPLLGNQGALIVNTELLEEYGLPTPTSIKDLANPEYDGYISVVDIEGSSTAWLMIQALVAEYGETEATEILEGIYANAGAHLEQSGSGPIKKVRAGEVVIGFGLRHQAVADKEEGLPIDFIDPTEGNYTLTESLAIVDKGEETNELALEMVECIVTKGRSTIQETYPVPLYVGESEEALSPNSKVYPETLTVELLEAHKAISDASK